MSRMNIKLKTLVAGCVMLAGVSGSQIPTAHASLTETDCTVEQPKDIDNPVGNKNSLRQALHFAHLGTPSNRKATCGNKIIIKTNIKMKQNLRIAIPETSANSPYIIEGDVGSNNDPAVLDFSALKRPKGKEADDLC